MLAVNLACCPADGWHAGLQVWGTCLGHQLLQILAANTSYDELLVKTDAVVRAPHPALNCMRHHCISLIAALILDTYEIGSVHAQSHPTTLDFTEAAEHSKAFSTMFTKRVSMT